MRPSPIGFIILEFNDPSADESLGMPFFSIREAKLQAAWYRGMNAVKNVRVCYRTESRNGKYD